MALPIAWHPLRSLAVHRQPLFFLAFACFPRFVKACARVRWPQFELFVFDRLHRSVGRVTSRRNGVPGRVLLTSEHFRSSDKVGGGVAWDVLREWLDPERSDAASGRMAADSGHARSVAWRALLTLMASPAGRNVRVLSVASSSGAAAHRVRERGSTSTGMASRTGASCMQPDWVIPGRSAGSARSRHRIDKCQWHTFSSKIGRRRGHVACGNASATMMTSRGPSRHDDARGTCGGGELSRLDTATP